MTHFEVKECTLRRNGFIRGARGHKKVDIPHGTRVWCIMYGRKFFWSVYLDAAAATKCAAGLEISASLQGLDIIVAWNFKYEMPTRVARPR